MSEPSRASTDIDGPSQRIAPRWTWIYAAAIGVYTFLATVGTLYYQWEPGLDVAMIPLAIAIWMEYLYLRYRGSGSHQGLMISGLGWLAVAIAFVLRGSGGSVGLLRMVVAFTGLLAILGGGIRAFMETRMLDEVGEPDSIYTAGESPERNEESQEQPQDATPGGR